MKAEKTWTNQNRLKRDVVRSDPRRRSNGHPLSASRMAPDEPAQPTITSPKVSVIVPVHNDPENLAACLEALEGSDYENFEVLVLDDASTDQTAQVAADYGVRVVRLESQSGPATARNRGAEVADGEYLAFFDADVCVEPETVSKIVGTFLEDPEIDAVFGSYDRKPAALNTVSRYRNLLHHSVHQNGRREAATFWSGCGAIKRWVFLELGGFDTDYGQPSIEDIELGVRLCKKGHRVVLNRDVQVKHLKRWTFWKMIKTDVMNRGVPWTLLALQQGEIPTDLNLKLSQRVGAILAYLLLATLVAGAWYWHGLLLIPMLAVLGVLMVDYWTSRGPVPTPFKAALVLGVLGAVVLLSVHFQLWTLVTLSLLLGIVLINFRFYALLARHSNPLFAFLILPLHVLYYLYSGLAFGIGVWLHLRKKANNSGLTDSR